MTVLSAVVVAALAAIGILVWTNLRAFRLAPAPRADSPTVSILIPARDEAAGISDAVRRACAQELPGAPSRVEVVVLDDGSTDATLAVLEGLLAAEPRLRVVRGATLPAGWAGKAWACWQLGSQHARHEWLLFVDADVRLEPYAAARALAAAHRAGAAFVSGFPRQVLGSAGEALLVPLIYLVLLAFLPMPLIRRHPRPSLSAACGQLMLVSRAAYLAAGGHRAIAATLHDGLKLARLMKAKGFPVAVFDGQDVASCRMYAGLVGTWRGFSRNAYEALGSPQALAAMVILNLTLFVLPFLLWPLALHGGEPAAMVLSGAAVAIVVSLRTVLAVRFGAPGWTVPATPIAVLAMTGIQLTSFYNHLTGRVVVWRARAYPGTVRTGGD